jgi:hypothetical protein
VSSLYSFAVVTVLRASATVIVVAQDARRRSPSILMVSKQRPHEYAAHNGMEERSSGLSCHNVHIHGLAIFQPLTDLGVAAAPWLNFGSYSWKS